MSSPPRVASLISSATEILYALGLGEYVIAVSHECDYPADVFSKPKATRSRIDSGQPSQAIDRQVRELCRAGQPMYEVDARLLRELGPDLIVTQAQCDVCAVRYQDVLDIVRREPALRKTRVITLNPQSLDDVLADIGRLAGEVGVEGSGQELTDTLRQRIARIRAATSRQPASRTRMICLEWIEPLMAAANWTPQLIELAGGESGLAVGGQHSGYNCWEDVRRYDPDVLLIAPCGFDLKRTIQEAQSLVGHSGWSDLRAVRHGRVFAMDGNAYLNRSGPRLVDTLEMIAHLLQPSRVAAPLTAGERQRALVRLETSDGRLVPTNQPSPVRMDQDELNDPQPDGRHDR
jgi:iron complex transport system substrate-binding protein